ncbi:MAG: DUF2500 family protein [Clostridia bacterium]|nr:DUF2500 family protein [Clostridia bacterium]
MEQYVYDGWVILVILFVIILMLIRFFVGTLRPKPIEQEDAEELPDPDLIHAQAIRKIIYGKNSGGKVSTYLVHFSIIFRKDDGSEEEFEMTQEQFDAIEEGELGLLMTVNGNFIDFGPEDIAANDN